MKKILLYGFSAARDPGFINAIQSYASENGIAVIIVSPQHFSLPVETFLNDDRLPEYTGEERQEDTLEARMLVFSGFESEQLFKALKDIRPMGLNPDDIKVSATPTNRKWSGSTLCREALREHKYMKSLEKK